MAELKTKPTDFRRLADLDVKVLEALIAASVAKVRRRYPHPGDA
jgi:hypothetical protein